VIKGQKVTKTGYNW